MSATREEVEAAVSDPAFSHARQGDGCWRDLVWIYHRDHKSPSGVILAVGADKAIADPIIRTRRATSALSPTER